MTTTPEAMGRLCSVIVGGIDAAEQWIDETRQSSPRLDRESDGLIDRLRQNRNLLRRLGAAAERPVSAGFFGLSQAGKSYLISALASSRQGELETILDGERLNFISHINPPGGGKEATGLVTRFTRHPVQTTPGYPVRLTLFAEADLVKILGNSFFNDFDRERVQVDVDPAAVRRRLASLEPRCQPHPAGGMNEDDVVGIRVYFETRFARSMELLGGDYWPTAVEIAPRLLPADRARLFSLLWGDIDELTQAYLTLRAGLEATGYARTVDAPLSALVKRVGDSWSQQDSIMNVDILNRLGKDSHDRLTVCPLAGHPPVMTAGGEGGVALARSLLAALTMEMVFVLADPPVVQMLEEVDLLDFPGYRGRLSVTSLEEVQRSVQGADPVASLILRGKVACLFERYTDDQEMNVLVMCSPSGEQNNVNSLGPVLEAWVTLTQGATPEERSHRLPGLLWAITKFDMRLAYKPGETSDTLQIGWDGMMKATLLERFEAAGWFREWSPGKPFDNVFLVRKPGMAASVIETSASGREGGVLPAQAERLNVKLETFLGSAPVQRHVRNRQQAWDAMMAPNDGGMSYLAASLGQVAIRRHKLERIAEQVEKVSRELAANHLGAFYQADQAGEVERKEQVAALVTAGLRQRPTSFGALLHALQPSPEHLRSLYLRTDSGEDPQPAAGATAAAVEEEPPEDSLISLDDFGLDDFGLDDPGASPELAGPATGAPEASPAAALRTSSGPVVPAGGPAARFSRAVIRDWIRFLRQLPDRPEFRASLGLAEDVLRAVVDEVITGALRCHLEDRMTIALREAEDHAGGTRNRLAGQQVLVACTLVNNYINSLGFAETPLAERPLSRAGRNRRIFTPPPAIAVNSLPVPGERQLNYSGIFIVDWLEAFAKTAVGNAGHAAGSDISPEQNRRLGIILKQIAGLAPEALPSGKEA